MNKSIAGLLLVGSMVLASGCVYVEQTEGSGVAETRRVELESFERLEINGAFDAVRVQVCDCDTQAIVRGDDNLIVDVDFDSDGTDLELDAPGPFVAVAGLEVSIQTRDIRQVEFNGTGNVSINGIFAESFDAENNGTGFVKLIGETRELDARNNGTGHIDASRLQAKNAHAAVSGTGDLEVCAVSELDADVSGTGSIFYSCTPATVDTNVSGVGSIEAVD